MLRKPRHLLRPVAYGSRQVYLAEEKSVPESLIKMKRLNTDKLHVTDLTAATSGIGSLPRRYTITHSDLTGDLYLTIADEYDRKQISKLYTRLMRDEVLAELVKSEGALELRVYCHVSGGLTLGTAKWRSSIFHSELPLVLEAIRYGDRNLFETDPHLDQTVVNVYFRSRNGRYNQVENWGVMADYR
jgi:hypothetical protein